MKLVDQRARIFTPFCREEANCELRKIELAGRVCYHSEDNNASGDFENTCEFIKRLIKSGHESVLEHSSMTVKFVVDRGLSHELVRHRLASFSQESTRYCNYSKDKFSNEISFIKPDFENIGSDEFEKEFCSACEEAEERYMRLVGDGVKPEIARDILPNCLATTLYMTANFREWRHVFRIRTSEKAHPRMRKLMLRLLKDTQKLIPAVFDDIKPV